MKYFLLILLFNTTPSPLYSLYADTDNMRRKDSTVETEFHPIITALLFEINEQYVDWGTELIISSGSEPTVKHGMTSLHYAKPARAVDLRNWEINRVPSKELQLIALRNIRDKFCDRLNIPRTWVEVIQESTHNHIEYQPKRQQELLTVTTGT
jgi:hypothetical protein